MGGGARVGVFEGTSNVSPGVVGGVDVSPGVASGLGDSCGVDAGFGDVGRAEEVREGPLTEPSK